MNSDQEAEFHVAVYHYFLWKACMERSKEISVEADMRQRIIHGGSGDSDLGKKLPAEKKSTVAGNRIADDKARDAVTPSVALHGRAPNAGDAMLDGNKQNLASPGSGQLGTLSQRYQLVAAQMLQQFPDQLSHFTSQHLVQMGLSTPPPIVRNLYVDLPRLQSGLSSTRNRVAQLESILKAEQSANNQTSTLGDKRRNGQSSENNELSLKRARLGTDTATPLKRGELNNIAGGKNTTLSTNNTTSTVATKKAEKPTVFSFDERVEQLLYFRKGHGHCRVPMRDGGLGRWVREMRHLYHARKNEGVESGVLTDDRIAVLDGIGFDWSLGPTAVPWESRYQELVKYKEQHGHCNVPRTDPKLGEFVHTQRMKHLQNARTMSEPTEKGNKSRTELLDEIGFSWYDGTTPRTTFEERLEECREFRRKHDHLRVPAPRRTSQDTYEGETHESRKERLFLQWALRMRVQYHKDKKGLKSTLDKTQVRKLNELGFDWEFGFTGDSATKVHFGKGKDDVAFKERVAILAQIKEKYGDCNDVKNLLAEGYTQKSSLYQWMKNQRTAWRNLLAKEYSSLDTERIALLRGVGFNFEPHKHRAPFGSLKAKRQSGSPKVGGSTTGDGSATRKRDGDSRAAASNTMQANGDNDATHRASYSYEQYHW